VKHIACAIFVRDRKILLARRAPHKTVYPNRWDVVGGHAETGETIEEALIREAHEEVGLMPLRFAAAGSLSQPQADLYGEAIFHFFVVTAWGGGEPSLLGDEHTQIGWFDIDEACALPDLARDEYRNLFRNLPR
jgi:8-oxo-dGTP diphosphatase